MPNLEKILVDTFCDKDLFYFYQGEELANIFEFANKRFQINISLLLRYADARSRKAQLINFIKQKGQFNIKLIQ